MRSARVTGIAISASSINSEYSMTHLIGFPSASNTASSPFFWSMSVIFVTIATVLKVKSRISPLSFAASGLTRMRMRE